MGFAILFVCTGNICRSPIAERLLVARLDGDAAVTPASAGTRAIAGHAMDRAAGHVLRKLGGDPDGHVARQLTTDLVRGADLVLAAATAHRSAIIQADPLAMRRTFTMREFARLGAGLDAPPAGRSRADLELRVAQVAALRGVSEPAKPGADEIADPYGAPLPVMQQCGQQVSAAIDGLVRVLGL